MKLAPAEYHQDVKTMSDFTSNTRSLNSNVSMDRVKKLLSPGTRKKLMTNGGNRIFGVPLEELVLRATTGCKVPFLVHRICDFIENKGFHHEGIFRINGNAKIVERLKTSFDVHGDANLEDEEDIMAVAGLLKLFLRELPDSVVPQHMTRQFVSIQEAYKNDNKGCIYQIKQSISELPEENYNLLRYLLRFLVVIAHNEKSNKMSPMSLAIVFGPNLFRCDQGIGGLKDQGTINQIVFKFIVHYESIFASVNEELPVVEWTRRQQGIAPPRPPPPKLQKEDYDDTPVFKPVPSPRKNKPEVYDVNVNQSNHDHEDWDQSDGSSSTPLGRPLSPRFSDDETAGRSASPFVLDSDGGFSMIESPIPSARTSEAVERVIAMTITENLFGDEDKSIANSVEFTKDLTNGDEGLESTDAASTDKDDTKSDELQEPGLPVKDRIRMFESQENENKEDQSKPEKNKPTSKAYNFFETKGLIITQAPQYLNKHVSSSDESDKEEEQQDERDIDTKTDGDVEFGSIKRNSATLSSFKRASGPLNRRSPSRKHRNSSGDPDMDNDVEELLADVSNKLKNNVKLPADITDNEQNPSENLHHQDRVPAHHPVPKPRVAFLELTNNTGDINNRTSPDDTSPSRSPSNNRKPFIPPLDLTTLHEHVDSQDAILAHKGQSVSYQRAKTKLNGEDGEDLQVILSPRTNKLTKRKHDFTESCTDIFENEAPHSPSAFQTGLWSYQTNTDVAPSPPFEQGQAQYKKHSTGSTEDEYMKKLKQHQRKIHVLKKKIKHFEDSFELEHGYRPSQADKSSKPEIKKHMNDITKAKKEIKKLKDDAEMESRSRHGSGASSSGERLDPPDLPPTMDKTLDLILRRLQDKRRELCRPEDLTLMNRDQVQEEKLAVQKALLYFEGIHGRPRTKDEKDLMRPLYDRYRTIKRLMSKPMSPRFSGELKTVPEDLPFDLETAQGLNAKEFRNPIIVPTADADDEDRDVDEDILGTMDFAVTRDFSIVPESDRPIPVDRSGHSPKAKRKLELQNDKNMSGDVNLHEMSVSELEDELIRSRSDKKKLRRLLRNFEEEFFHRTGRKVQREDRTPLNSQYHDYKQIKAKLKLLEALLSKYHHSSKA